MCDKSSIFDFFKSTSTVIDGHCEVYSSLKGYLFEISVFYQERN